MIKFLTIAVLAFALAASCAANGPALKVGQKAPAFHLTDQFNKTWTLDGQKNTVTVVVTATRDSGEAMGPWVDNLKTKYGKRIQILGLIDLHSVPGIGRGFARSRIRSETKDPIMVDFDGSTAKAYAASDKYPVVVVIGKDLDMKAVEKSKYTTSGFADATEAIDAALR